MNAPIQTQHLEQATELSVDYITILECHSKLRLTKTWQADGEIRASDKTKQHNMYRKKLTNFAALCEVLDRIATSVRAAVIRGAPLEEFRTKKKGIFRDKYHFIDEPHHWVVFDVDKYEPSVDPIAFPAQAIEEFIKKELPECFHYVACRWMLSSSAGAPGKAHILKAHLAFWFARPYSSAQLKIWAQANGLNVDLALFDPVQWHYMANPVFEGGIVDPVPVRYGVIDGFEQSVDLVIPEGLVVSANARAYEGGDIELPDPKKKRGVVGAFCRAFDIDDCLERWGEELPYEFESANDNRRLNYLEGSGAPGGAFISPCRQYLINKHESSPYGARATNAFDLMRVHRYGALDEEDDDFFAGDPTRGASFQKMKDWAQTLPEVQEEMRAHAGAENTGEELGATDEFGDEGEQGEQRPTAVEVLAKLRSLSNTEVLEQWPGLSADLGAVDLHTVIREVSRLTEAPIQPLRTALADYKRNRSRLRKIAALQETIAGREDFLYDPTNVTLHGLKVENLILKSLAADGRTDQYVTFAGRTCTMVEDRLPHSHAIDDDDPDSAPVVPTMRELNKSEMRARIEAVSAFTKEDKDGIPKPCEVPLSILDWLLTSREGHEAPVVTGLVPHPIVRPNGDILATPGVHPSGLIVAGDIGNCRPYSQEEAREAIERIRGEFCSGFLFETPLDQAAALAALFTGVERKVLDQAPGVLVLASMQGTGKTTLTRRLHVLLTGRELAVVTFPKQVEEQQKTLFALLRRSPAMVCFDNIPDGLNFRSAELAAAMTNPSYGSRVLGVSDGETVPTNTLFAVTGNNLTLGRDELSRMIPVRLTTGGEKLGHRQFAHPDVVGHALKIRAGVLQDVVGIVAGYLATRLQHTTATRSRFLWWDRMVRQPLLWAGVVEDIADVFDNNESGSDELAATSYVLQVLYEQFDGRTFTAREVVDLPSKLSAAAPFEEGEEDRGQELADAIAAVPCSDPKSADKVGHMLKRLKGNTVTIAGENGENRRFKLEKAEAQVGSRSKKSAKYRVVLLP
ncbi:MAG: hypothetical protein Q7J47_22960 [Azoarcus sp.]|nr:hypothetical protein [Azoarcus sp.]